MAIYQGTRLGSVGFPGAPEAEASSRAVRPPVAATPRIRPAVLLVAIILVGTIVGLAYLTQTLGANASNAELGRLASQRDQSQRQLLTQRSMIAARTADGEIEERATLSGLVDLGDAFIVRVR